MAAPTISSILPASGPAHTKVVITGSNFANPVVDFNGIAAQVIVDSTTQLTVTSPIGASTGPVHVVTAGGTATTSFTVTNVAFPVINSFSVTEGVAGTSLIIKGTNFIGATVVSFNGTSAAFTVNSGAQITTSVPVGATTGKVSITNASGTTSSTDNFTVPTIINLTKTTGATVNVSWIYSAANEPLITSFKLQTAANSTGPWTDVSTLPVTARSTTFAAPSVGTYSYRVASVNSTTNQVRSSTNIYRLTVVSAEPVAPTLTSVSAPNPTSIVWNHTNVANETGYEYQTSFDLTTWTVRGTAASDNIAFTWAAATAGTFYYMRVASIGSSGTRYPSNVLSVTTPTNPPPEPTAPVLNSFTASSPTSLVWSHADVANETGYEYETSPDNVTWTFRGSNIPNVTTFTWSGAAASTLYYGRVKSVGTSGARYPSNVLNVTTPAFEPVAPVLASVSAPSYFSITWNHNNVANETGYQYETSATGVAPWTVRGTAPANTTTFTWNGATQSTTYFMRVGSVGQSGTVYESNVLSVTTPASAPPEPVAPVLSSFTAPDSTTVTWVNTNVANETGYNYETSFDGLSGWIIRGTAGVNNTTFSWGGAAMSTLYYGRCSSIGPSGTTYASNVLSVTTPGTPPPPPPPEPPAPTLTSAQALDATHLQWTHTNVIDELGYNYETSPDNLNWTIRGTAPANNTTFTWAGATQLTPYYMRVSSIGPAANHPSNVILVTTPAAPPVEPAAPTLSAFTASSSTTLVWTFNNVADAVGYDFETSPDNATWTLRGSTSAPSTTFTWGGATASTLYYGRVSSFGASGTRHISNVLNVTTPPAPVEPSAPTLLNVSANSATSITWSHTDVTDEIGYEYETSFDQTTWTTRGSNPPDITDFTWTAAAPSTLYFMRASSVGNISTYPSNVLNVTTPALVVEPTSPILTQVTATNSFLTWTNTNVLNETGYNYETSSDNVNWVTRGSTAAESTSFIWPLSAPNTKYYMRVSSFSSSGITHPSNVLFIKSPPASSSKTVTVKLTAGYRIHGK